MRRRWALALILLGGAGCAASGPCAEPLGAESGLVPMLRRLDADRCVHADDVDAAVAWMDTYHRQTTLHCDDVWRRSSDDGFRFDGEPERVVRAASVADAVVLDDGRHLLAYNDTRPGLLGPVLGGGAGSVGAAGLVGYGGVGLAVLDGDRWSRLPLDLGLSRVQEAVDPDIGLTPDGRLRLVWFGVTPDAMNPAQHGPMMSAKPHRLYRSFAPVSALTDGRGWSVADVVVASSEGSSGGTDPAVAVLPDGRELLVMGPLDHTAVGWWSTAGGEIPDPRRAPDLDTQISAATPDLVLDPAGGLRMYHMVNGRPGRFAVSHSVDGLSWSVAREVLVAPDEFNISVAVDGDGVWWAYTNRSDAACLAEWGVRRVRPGQVEAGSPPGTPPLGAPVGPPGAGTGAPRPGGGPGGGQPGPMGPPGPPPTTGGARPVGQ